MKQNFSKYLSYNEYLNDVEAGMFNNLSSSIQFIEDKQNDVIKVIFRQGLLTSSQEILSIDYRNIINTELDKSIDYWVANDGEKIYELFADGCISTEVFKDFVKNYPYYYLRPISDDGTIVQGYEDLPLYKMNMSEYNIPAGDVTRYALYNNETNEYVADVRLSSIFIDLYKDDSVYYYSIGCLADIHHDASFDNDYYNNGGEQSGPQSASDLNNALNYFEQNENVKFITVSGDLSVQQSEEATAFVFNNFPYENENPLDGTLTELEKEILISKGPVGCRNSKLSDLDSFRYNAFEKISPNTPLFCARGNHDIAALRAARSVELINRKSYDLYALNHEGEHTGGPDDPKIEKLWAYYTHPSNNKTIPSSLNIVYQFPEKGIDKTNSDNYYVYDTNTDDVYIFFSLYNNNFWDGSKDPYKTEDFAWLCETLNEFRNKRTFVFLHLFFDDKCGGYKHIYPDWAGSNCGMYKNAQYLRLQWLSDYYKNSIWISGHSHWRWCSQSQDTYANVYHKSVNPELGEYGGWCVHIPSGVYPRTDNGDGVSQHEVYFASEGALIDIYKDYIEIHGIVFKDFNHSDSEWSRLSNTTPENQYINYVSGIANYRFNVGGKNLINIDSLI